MRVAFVLVAVLLAGCSSGAVVEPSAPTTLTPASPGPVGGSDPVATSTPAVVTAPPSPALPTTPPTPLAPPIPTGPCVESGRHLAITRAAAAGSGNFVYVFGGVDPSGKIVDDVQKFDPVNGTIETIAHLRSPRADVAVTVDEEKGLIYLVGGTLADGSWTSEVLRFETRGESFRLVGQFSFPRSNVAAATDGDKLYVVGGVSPRGNLRDIAIVDLVTGGVANADARMPIGRHSATAVYLPDEKQVLIAGGVDDRNQNSSAVFLYDVVKDTLTPAPALPEGASDQFTIWDNRTGDLYLLGGRTDDGPSPVVWRYNSTAAFETLDPRCEPPRVNAAVATTAIGTFLIGGNDQNGTLVRSILRFDPFALDG